MVKRRFLTHFKPWLLAVVKAGALIVGYQSLDEVRRHFQYVPFDISDVLKIATVTLVALAVFCGLWAWGEWCWFKLRIFRKEGLQRAGFQGRRYAQAVKTATTGQTHGLNTT